jgi:hypothetical protein
MITGGITQRWQDRRSVYRIAGIYGERFNSRLYEVAEIADDTTALAFVTRHHYSGSYSAAIKRFGLYRREELVGLFVGSGGNGKKVLPKTFPDAEGRPIECSRFVLLPEVEADGETWFKARCRELLVRDGFTGLLAFSDDIARTDSKGVEVFGGHLGIIYQASNALFLGRATARTIWLLPDGRVFNERSIQKVRAGERGWRGAARTLENLGAPTPPEDEAGRRAWLYHWLRALLRSKRHPGNLKYAWRLVPRVTVAGTPQRYPKLKFAERQVTLF